MTRSVKKLLSIGAMSLLLAGELMFAQTTRPTTAPEAAADQQPAEEAKPAVVSDEAQRVLDGVRDAYAKLNSLDLAGTVSVNLDAMGEKQNENSSFTASFQSPIKFRHEMKDDVLIVSNGEKSFFYKPDEKKYVPLDSIKERVEEADLPGPLATILEQQNPSLLLAIVKDAAATLIADIDTVDRQADVVIDGTSFQVMSLKNKGSLTTVLVNPQTHLVRQVTIDLKDRLVAKGVPQVNAAMVKIDYTRTSTDVAPVASAFDWTPPADAMQVKLSGGGETGAAEAMAGKPASDFSLKDLDNKTVTLASLKGHVVVLDFWATWCGPCVESLPHLDELASELSPGGVRFFAVNLREAKPVVQKFVTDHKLKLSVLLDTDGVVGDAYKAEAIPETVVIGKDGVVRKVFIGSGPDAPAQIRAAVEAALKS